MDNNQGYESFRELERQVERGSLFTHTLLTNQIIRLNESDSFLFGLIDYLSRKGLVNMNELQPVVELVRKEIVEKKEYATLGVAIRIEEQKEMLKYSPVNCKERIHICKAICCKLSFPLTVQEIESGVLKWSLGKPYYNRRCTNGYCYHIQTNNVCSVYQQRPSVCRKYTCANDKRIWKDFDKKELNNEWIESNLKDDKIELVEMFVTKM
jgi:Fe-S-cluster containining protein